MNATRDPLPVPAKLVAAGPPRPASLTLYDRPGIRITGEWFIVTGRRFRIDELADLRTARGPHAPVVARAVVAAAVVLAGMGVVLGFTSEVTQIDALTYLALGVAALVPVTVALLGQRLRPPHFELWGRYRGMTVLLFSSDDERQYGQVTRALVRAQEVARLGGVAEPVAASDPWPFHPRRPG